MNIYFSTWTHIFSDLHSDLIWVGAVTMPGLRLRDGQVSDFLDLSISLFQLFLGVFSFPWGIVVSKVLNGMEWSEDLIKVVSIYVPAKKIFLDQELKIIVVVMVGGPAVGKAGDCLDWIAGGLEMKELKDSGNPCPL